MKRSVFKDFWLVCSRSRMNMALAGIFIFVACCACMVFDISFADVQLLLHGYGDDKGTDPKNISVSIVGPNHGSICIDCQNQVQLDAGPDQAAEIEAIQKVIPSDVLGSHLILNEHQPLLPRSPTRSENQDEPRNEADEQDKQNDLN